MRYPFFLAAEGEETGTVFYHFAVGIGEMSIIYQYLLFLDNLPQFFEYHCAGELLDAVIDAKAGEVAAIGLRYFGAHIFAFIHLVVLGIDMDSKTLRPYIAHRLGIEMRELRKNIGFAHQFPILSQPLGNSFFLHTPFDCEL